MPAEQLEQQQDTEVQELCEEIAAAVGAVYDVLIERRDTAYSAAIEPLDQECERLEAESTELLSRRNELLRLLDARRRVSQYESDSLLLAGKHEEAQAKRGEMEQAERAPKELDARCSAIRERIEGIVEDKRACARRVYESWRIECEAVIRAAERGLFLTLLDGLWNSFLSFEAKTCPQRSLSERPMVSSGHRSDLTAPERSEEWETGHRWYSGRIR